MGIYGNTPRYRVHWQKQSRQGPCNRVEGFEGERAFSEASDLYEQLRADPEVVELDVARLEGGVWVWHVAPLRRNTAGEWEQGKEGLHDPDH